MLKGFRDFLMRGNVVELATAVIIGAAFTAIVTAFTDKIVNPLIASIPVNTDMGGLGFEIRNGMQETFVDFGAVITAFINFVIVAAVVYFLIVIPYNKLQELRKLDEDATEDQVSLLTEIRDLLDPDFKERKAAEAAEVKAMSDAEARQLQDRQSQPVGPPGFGDGPGNGGPTTGGFGPGGPGTGPQQPIQGGDATRQMSMPPQGQQRPEPSNPPSGSFPTPNPAPGEYPPPGNLPPGQQYAPGQYPQQAPGQYPPPPQGDYPPGQFPDGPRHSR
ncbi:large-conductance mechanosensitive channel protein MscL [Gordonia zhaorongruii]|uniref:large-conductance mechanosensitive channel protein MscL n=1 Tax=Gordonia zhaorongruii TaxID=2597659 RepID=UPI00117E3DBF|nr:large-conductance mechanosensitive channel protein MscL [Gordonia zhaorongruii]